MFITNEECFPLRTPLHHTGSTALLPPQAQIVQLWAPGRPTHGGTGTSSKFSSPIRGQIRTHERKGKDPGGLLAPRFAPWENGLDRILVLVDWAFLVLGRLGGSVQMA